MKIAAIETIRLPDRPNLLLAQVHTDQGLVGLGDTSRGAAAVEAQIHELVAPYLLGQDGPGLGTRLLPDLLGRPGVLVKRSAVE
jgi:L-alanine-DL-glutamate epimerase-like enolase superfamily enzyme